MPEQVALVTGGSRGIGRAVSIELARGGHPVAVNYRKDSANAKETLALVQSVGGEGVLVQADIREPDDVAAMFDFVEDALGPAQVLVNNAGIRADALALRTSDDRWQDVLDTNLTGAFLCSRRALRSMIRAGWGRIVNISSVAGVRGSSGQANYCAAKAGLIGLTRSLAREVARRGITVNVVAPGLIDTDLTSDLTAEQRAALVAEIPSGRPGTPEEVAQLAAFVCGDRAAYINGATLTIDGGMTS